MAHVGASARAMARERERAKEDLLGNSSGVDEEKIPWSQFASAQARPIERSSMTEDLLAYHKQEHERLSEDMLLGAAFLNNASQAISQTLAKDASQLKELDDLQSENRATLTKERERITKQTSRTCSFTLVTIGICVVVLIGFLWMVMIIRVTSKSK